MKHRLKRSGGPHLDPSLAISIIESSKFPGFFVKSPSVCLSEGETYDHAAPSICLGKPVLGLRCELAEGRSSQL